jgi:hypothetical protein
MVDLHALVTDDDIVLESHRPHILSRGSGGSAVNLPCNGERFYESQGAFVQSRDLAIQPFDFVEQNHHIAGMFSGAAQFHALHHLVLLGNA